MDLSKATTKELRAELHRRAEAEREARWRQVCEAFPCPECGANPTEVIYAPYDSEQGTTEGMRYRTTVVCENGHSWHKDGIRWFEEPRKGPPLLPAGGRGV